MPKVNLNQADRLDHLYFYDGFEREHYVLSWARRREKG